MDGFDINKLFNEPQFTIDTQKYIDKCNQLLNDIDKYIEMLNTQIKNADLLSAFGLRCQLIMCEYQREIVQQTIKSLKFYSH